MNSKGTASHRNKGKIGEDIAMNYVMQLGYKILVQNYYYNHGEIDIVANDGKVLVFIEVKFRRSTGFGEPEESVTPKKQELLRRTAEGYVAEKNITGIDCRFDVVSVKQKDGKATCSILKNCF